MSNPDAMSVIAGETFPYIARDNRVNGVSYNNLFLNGEGVKATYDPNVHADPILAAGYWPGGIDAEGHPYVACIVNGHSELNAHDERIFMRDLILSAELDPAALQRHEKRLSEEERIIERAGSLAVAGVIALCRGKQAPLSYVIVSKVLKSDRIDIGERVATLYYPMGLPPRVSLKKLRRQVEDAIAEETL